MKIRSKFKDYYDFVGRRYGEDPDVLYNRGSIPSKDYKVDPGRGRYPSTFASYWMKSRESVPDRTTYQLEILVAGELIFPVVRMITRNSHPVYELPDTVAYRHLDQPTLHWLHGSSKYEKEERIWKSFSEALEKLRPKLREAMVKLQAPVFLYRADGIDTRVPILSDFDIPSRIRPEDMWQNIYSVHQNVLRPNPDKMVPVQISEKDRIVKAGFDLKTSFRNPVNPKPRKKGTCPSGKHSGKCQCPYF
jgi:hypothetical protein